MEKTPKIEGETSFQHPQLQSQQPFSGQVYSNILDNAGINQELERVNEKFGELDRKRVNLTTDIIGLFETVTSAPTGTPIGPWGQIKIYNNKLYFYDSVSKTWDSTAGSGSQGGLVNAAGTAGAYFPAGWSVARPSTGVYTVTHNLGSTSYAVVCTIIGSAVITIYNITNRGSNSFTITFYNQTGSITWAAANTDFDFILTTT